MNPDDVIKVLEAIKEMASPAAQQMFAYALKATVVGAQVGMSTFSAVFLIGITTAVGGWKVCHCEEAEYSAEWQVLGLLTVIIGVMAIIGSVIGFGVNLTTYLAPELPALRSLLGR